MKATEERAYRKSLKMLNPNFRAVPTTRELLVEMATEQKQIDDANLAEVKRQRDEYYEELLKLRQQKAIDDKVAFEEREKAFKAGYDTAIKTACEWLADPSNDYFPMIKKGWQEAFRKAMEELDD